MGIHVLGAHAVTTDNRGRVLAGPGFRQPPAGRGGPECTVLSLSQKYLT